MLNNPSDQIYFNRYQLVAKLVDKTLDNHDIEHYRYGLFDKQTNELVIPIKYAYISKVFDNQKVFMVYLDDCFSIHEKTYYNIETQQMTLVLDENGNPIHDDLEKIRQHYSNNPSYVDMHHNPDGTRIMLFNKTGNNIWTISDGTLYTWATQGYSAKGNQYIIGEDGQLALNMKLENLWSFIGDYVPIEYKADAIDKSKILKKTGNYATKRVTRSNYYNMLTKEFVEQDVIIPVSMNCIKNSEHFFTETISYEYNSELLYTIINGKDHHYITPPTNLFNIHHFCLTNHQNHKQGIIDHEGMIIDHDIYH